MTVYANEATKPTYPKRLGEWINPSDFTHPAVIDPNGQASTFIASGNTHRNQFVGPAYKDVDLSLFKNFGLSHGVVGQFRAEVFNLTNTPAFTNPNGDLDNCIYSAGTTEGCPSIPTAPDHGSFGQVEGVRASSERQMQLSMHLTF